MKYIILLLLPLSAYALDMEFKGSVAGKSGNTNSSGQLLESKIKAVFRANTLSSSVAYSRDSKDHSTYSEGYRFKIMDEYKFSVQHGAYVKYEFYRDTFRGYGGQNKYGLGYLRYWTEHFKTRIGYKYYDEKDHLVIGYIFHYEIFRSRLDYEKYVIEFSAGLKFKVFGRFSIEFIYEHIYRDRPLNNSGKTDSKYYTMLVVNLLG